MSNMTPSDIQSAQGARALGILTGKLPEAIIGTEETLGEVTVIVSRERFIEAITLLRDAVDGQYRLPVFVTAVDHPDREPTAPRFDVVYQLRSLAHNDTCRIIVRVPEDDPTIPSVERLFAGMDWHERETFDLYGIVFTGHHDLQRILLPSDWEGHPLRKDYISFGEPIAFTHNLEWALPAQERPPELPGESR